MSLNKKPVYVIDASKAKLHLSKGNSKLGQGIWAFSTLPGNKDHLLVLNKTAVLTDILGTCSKFCDGCFEGGCYAVNSAKLHHNAVIQAWAENTILLRAGKLFKEIQEFIEKKNAKYRETGNVNDIKVRVFRINVSGEIENTKEFEEWNALAARNPEVTFSVYTKNFDDLDEFMKKHGDTEENFVINISQWHGVADAFLAKYPGKFNVFEFDDSNRKNCGMSSGDVSRLASTTHCPAVTKSGHHAKDASGNDITCDHCKRCYRKRKTVTAVYAH